MITIRRIRLGETSLYRGIRLQALKEAPYAFCDSYESAIQRTEENWQQQADRAAQGESRAIFMAFEDESPIGLSAIYRNEDQRGEAELFQVWVSPATRGAGLGTKIMDTVLEWAENCGYERVIANIISTNKRALGFYMGYGFEIRSESAVETKMVKRTRSD